MAAIALAVLGGASQPSRVSAGGFLCFMCHGVNFEGSDIAPTVAGTKLTDEQIANQMRHPRGVMPAFGPNDWPDPQTAISYIRAQPTGKPTMTLSPEQRSAALAMIAGVAAARATAVLESQSAALATLTSAPPATAVVTPSPIPATATPVAANPDASTGSAFDTSTLPLGIFSLSGLLVMLVGLGWWLRRS